MVTCLVLQKLLINLDLLALYGLEFCSCPNSICSITEIDIIMNAADWSRRYASNFRIATSFQPKLKEYLKKSRPVHLRGKLKAFC